MHKAVFTVLEDKKTLVVEKAFDASLEKVWQAWTTQELLEQWWSPAPWKIQTKSFDFSVGGYWHYAMVGPEDETHWSWMDYLKIEPQQMIKGTDRFCDEAGVTNDAYPTAEWTNHYEADGETTKVSITTVYQSPENLQQVLDMGMEQGLTLGLNQLSKLLTKI